MNIDLDEATAVAFECASRFYKATEENDWGQINKTSMPQGISRCEFIASHMIVFLLNEYENSSYIQRVSALKSVVTVFEGVMARSKNLGNAPRDPEEKEFINDCKNELSASAICKRAEQMLHKMQDLQTKVLTTSANKKAKM